MNDVLALCVDAHHNNKLITTEPCNEIVGFELTSESVGDLNQQLITNGVAIGIIDEFEFIKIQGKENKALVVVVARPCPFDLQLK